MRSATVAFIVFAALAVSTANAGTLDTTANLFAAQASHDPWHVDWLATTAASPAPSTGQLVVQPVAPRQADQPAVHAAAVEHSSAYETRAKIHRLASWATLPLFAAQLALGESLYNGTENDWEKGMHAGVGAAIVGLFGVNTLTGVWNLFGESWNDPGRGMRLVHGLLMLAADAGFAATSMSTPDDDRGFSFAQDRSTHRKLAYVSIGTGTAGYLLMLIGNR